MTEDEWLHSDWFVPQFDYVCRSASNRKCRLFSVACCRLVWDYLGTSRNQQIVELSEQYADRNIAYSQLRKLCPIDIRPSANRDLAAWYCARMGKVEAPLMAAWCAARVAIRLGKQQPGFVDASQSAILRDIFGNPFRPVTFDPRWRTSDVVGVARGIYEDKAFERMPILADALMDAGCEDEQIIGHCRGDGPHVRGCWVVDLVLGKV